MHITLRRLIRILTLWIAIGLLGTAYSGVASQATWKAFQPTASALHASTQTAEQSRVQLHVHAGSSDPLCYAPVAGQRCLSMASLHFTPEPPVYALLQEWPLPQLLVVEREFIPPEQRHPWMLQYDGPRWRLSGWKDANLQYRFSQQA